MPWRPLEGDAFPSLGYLVADWIESFLLRPDTTEREPFVPTVEQLDFLVALYEIDPNTLRRVKHRGVLSRSRGWGKSPFLAAIGACEGMGPVLCDGFDAEGQPVGVPWVSVRSPLVQFGATTEDQVANTWLPLLEMLRGSPAEDEYDLEPMDSFVSMPSGRLAPITSSATSVKGARAVCAVLDQTETWLPGNGGIRLAQTLRNNATKLGGVTIESPNAFTIGQGSVAEKTAQFAEQVAKGKIKPEAARVLLYDHRPAPLETDISDMGSLSHGLRVAYGDSSGHPDGCLIHEPPCPPGWVDIERVAADFWDTANDPAVMCADFLNQTSAASDSWLTQPEVRAIRADVEISKTEPVTLGFDGSEGRSRGIADSTVLVAYSVKQHHLWVVGHWGQPDGPKGDGWKPPRLEIEQTVEHFFKTHNVVGFYADHSAGWAEEVKTWEATYHARLKAKISSAEPIRWPQRNVSMACETFAQLLSAIRAKGVTYDGHPAFTAHLLNARMSPRSAGYVLKKPDDDQDYSKIDLVWGAMFAYRAGLDAVGLGVGEATKRWAPRRLY